MKNDEVISNICIEISQELKEEGIDISPQEAFKIANSQFIAMALAKSRGLSARLDYIGNFIFKNKTSYMQSVKEVEKLKDKVTPEAYKRIVKEKRIANKRVMSGINHKTIERLEDMPGEVKGNSALTYWNNVYKELIE